MYVRICGRGIQCTEQCTERCIYTREIIAIGGALVSSRYIDLASLPNTEDFLLRRAAATANPVPRRRSSSVATFRPSAIAPHDPPCCCVNVTVTVTDIDATLARLLAFASRYRSCRVWRFRSKDRGKDNARWGGTVEARVRPGGDENFEKRVPSPRTRRRAAAFVRR